MNVESENHTGYRGKLHQKFRSTSASLFDKELLESLLMYTITRKDTALLVEKLINRFNSLLSILFALSNELLNVPGVGESSITLLNQKAVFSQR